MFLQIAKNRFRLRFYLDKVQYILPFQVKVKLALKIENMY